MAKKIDSLRHKDTRVNIPTEELRDFVAEDEQSPKTMRYPRDPSLDPQLVWKGKDELDAGDLAVPVVPVYIQEKIHPQALIEDLRKQQGKGEGKGVAEAGGSYQLNLFADFNGIEADFSRKVDFYSHDTGSQPHWSNRLILGDSLLVMTSLAEKEGLKGQVQMIYIDPPYGITFNSNWQVSTRKREVKDGKAEDATRQPEQIRAFRDTWKLGIHSYLAYLRDRLAAARELLTETGSIFVQIGEENVHLVRCLMDEVFGSENFRSLITFKTTSAQTTEDISNIYDFVIWYFKDISQAKKRKLLIERDDELLDRQFDYVEKENGKLIKLTHARKKGIDLKKCPRVKLDSLTSEHISKTRSVPFKFRDNVYYPHEGRQWATSLEGLRKLVDIDRIFLKGKNIFWKRYSHEFGYTPLDNMWTDTTATGTRKGDKDKKNYIVQTMTKVIQRCMIMSTDTGDLVLDPTCGSGTTAFVAEQWGRRWITMDTSRVALALARTRLMAAKYPYYLLADSREGLEKEAEISGKVPPDYPTENDIKKGFVYKRVPHVTLKSIANNPEIDTIHARWQEKLEPLREKINRLAGEQWEEWEIPRAFTPGPSPGGRGEEAQKELEKQLAWWWELRRERQQEIDAAIAKNAEPEMLYDQPYEDNKRIRVTGPFTVESLSPHRVLSTADENFDGTVSGPEKERQQDFAQMILENLRKAGVQNTRKNERIRFDTLEPYAGTWIQAQGTYSDAEGSSKRAAISIGPEHGTVGPQQVKEAAKEAVQGIGFDILIACGFAFDPHVSEEAKRYGKLTVLPTRMNPDLAMGDELLKKTGAGNLFMVFGEPDVEIRKEGDKITVELAGVDVYDPTTGAIRSSSTDDVACWFIDTDYNGESFFVRHAYFTGSDAPYDKLKRALRAEVDEEAWESLYSTASRPFESPKSGKIAIKVINHYGDEVLKVFEV
ncbi:MAG: site-specific DNA-methyltransferase [Candidatus Brocadia sp. WS118]|nr:MAG: site-specific DNA-methyltransferase [Candidatus Brocadia sp. WS118]